MLYYYWGEITKQTAARICSVVSPVCPHLRDVFLWRRRQEYKRLAAEARSQLYRVQEGNLIPYTCILAITFLGGCFINKLKLYLVKGRLLSFPSPGVLSLRLALGLGHRSVFFFQKNSKVYWIGKADESMRRYNNVSLLKVRPEVRWYFSLNRTACDYIIYSRGLLAGEKNMRTEDEKIKWKDQEGIEKELYC